AEFAQPGALAPKLFVARKLAFCRRFGRCAGNDAPFARGDIVAPERADKAPGLTVEVRYARLIGGEFEAAGDDRAGPGLASNVGEREVFVWAGHAERASWRIVSRLATDFGMATLRTSAPVAVTRTSSSMRMPPKDASSSTRSQLTASANASRRSGSWMMAGMK